MTKLGSKLIFVPLSLAINLLLSEIGRTDEYGPSPTLPPPQRSLIPTVRVAHAVGWPSGTAPIVPKGLAITALADKLEHPRWLYVLPNGDVLVAETNAPPKPEDSKGFKGWAMKKIMKNAGAATSSANRITLLRDTDGDGVADLRSVFLQNLNSPFGMALIGDDFYVANTDAVFRFPYQKDQTEITGTGTKIVDLPAGPINHHWTKNLIASPDGNKLYVSVGSNSNIAENGIENEKDRAAIWEIDLRANSHRLFATGLRNPVGLTWGPEDKLWVSVNERDELGNDLVPDYMTSVVDDGFYGWPYSYYGQHVDARVKPQKPDLVASALVPDYALGAHTASLGLVFSGKNTLPSPFNHGFFIGQHGSWNRDPPVGYKVVFVPASGGKPSSAKPLDVVTGFLNNKGEALGRPVGVAIDSQGALLISDDVGNTVWRVKTSAQ